MSTETCGELEEATRTRSGCSTYYMRHWLILLRRSQLLISCPLPLSMLHPQGIQRNMSHHQNLCIRVVKFGLEFFSISFTLLYFTFLSFYFYLLNLGLGFNMTSLTYCHISHDTVTSHVVAIEGCKRF